MWKIKQFKTQAELSRWVQRNYGKYQFVDVFIDNAYCVEYRPLRKIY